MFSFQHKPSKLTLHYTCGKTTPNSALHSPHHSEYLPWSNLRSWVLQQGMEQNVSQCSVLIRSNGPVLAGKNWNLAGSPGRTVTYWSYWKTGYYSTYNWANWGATMLSRLYNTAKPMYGFSLYSNPVQLPVSAPGDGWVSYIYMQYHQHGKKCLYHLVPLK